MTDNQPNYPPEAIQPPDVPMEEVLDEAPIEMPVPQASQNAAPAPLPNNGTPNAAANEVPLAYEQSSDEIHARLERLGGEPAPDITPEEFARLQQSGQIHIDPRGRVRSSQTRTPGQDAGVSLRKRRAWYSSPA